MHPFEGEPGRVGVIQAFLGLVQLTEKFEKSLRFEFGVDHGFVVSFHQIFKNSNAASELKDTRILFAEPQPSDARLARLGAWLSGEHAAGIRVNRAVRNSIEGRVAMLVDERALDVTDLRHNCFDVTVPLLVHSGVDIALLLHCILESCQGTNFVLDRAFPMVLHEFFVAVQIKTVREQDNDTGYEEETVADAVAVADVKFATARVEVSHSRVQDTQTNRRDNEELDTEPIAANRRGEDAGIKTVPNMGNRADKSAVKVFAKIVEQ